MLNVRDKQLKLLASAVTIHQQLTRREKTYRDISRQFNCSKDVILSVFHMCKLTPPSFSKGPKNHIPSEIQIIEVKNYALKFRVGYQRCCFALNLRGFSISEWTTRKIYELEGLFCFEKEYLPSNHHKLRFVAPYAGQLWHTDLHFLSINEGEVNKYIIAFIDDRTRFLIHAEILTSKSAIFTASALRNALSKESKPYMITIDNGTEFIGQQFQNVLEEFNIKCHRTHPYTPQENGKIERWWKTFDRSLFECTSMEDLINEYNYYWPHRSLQELNQKKTTPADAWRNMEHWENKENFELIYQDSD